MNKPTLIIKSPEHLLAQFIAMKCESEDRLQDLSDSLKQHNNMPSAEIYMRVIELIKVSIKNIEQKTERMNIPDIPPWESQWHYSEQPDLLCVESAHYLMSPLQALELALCTEKRMQEFLQQQINNTMKDEIQRIAKDLLVHEQQMAEQMLSWKDPLEKSQQEQVEDFDPPNMPE